MSPTTGCSSPFVRNRFRRSGPGRPVPDRCLPAPPPPRQKGYPFSAPADRPTLLRRRHVRPDRPAADAGRARRLPEGRLAATPTRRSSIGCWRRRAFGERQALPWLDLVRFAETDGFKADDPRPARLAVPRLRHPVASTPTSRTTASSASNSPATSCSPTTPTRSTATGFLRHYPDEYNAVNLEQRRQEILNDITDTTAAGVPRADARLRPVPRPQVRPDHAGRLLPHPGVLRRLERGRRRRSCRRPSVAAHERRVREWEAKTADVRKQTRRDRGAVPRRSSRRSGAAGSPRSTRSCSTSRRRSGRRCEQQIAAMVGEAGVCPGREGDVRRHEAGREGKAARRLKKQLAEAGPKPHGRRGGDGVHRRRPRSPRRRTC